MQRLADRVAVVIGAGSIGPGWGNGKATAVLFAREGARVFAVDANGAAARETVDVIRSESGEAAAHEADATEPSQVEGLVTACLERYGRIDVLHHNVGIVRLGGPVALPIDVWRRVLDVNLTSCFLACKHVLPVMERQGRGAIVTIGSVAGMRWTGFPYVAYSATKAALVALTRSVALEYAARGIRANCIVPGLLDTPLIRHGLQSAYAADDEQRMLEIRNAQCPTGHMGDAWDVARAAVFLASDESRYVTGTTLVVDGGLTSKYA
jgi:NAD(P)-dependent dehydrogenase (short-subunit alcohol dehydrogenase family)